VTALRQREAQAFAAASAARGPRLVTLLGRYDAARRDRIMTELTMLELEGEGR
jgi:hypothetical protein